MARSKKKTETMAEQSALPLEAPQVEAVPVTTEEKFGDATGIFYDLPDSIYHACKLPSNSGIKIYTKLPALYELQFLSDSPEAEEMKQHFQLGKAYELLMLEPKKAGKLMTFKTKTYNSQEAAAAALANPDSILLSAADLPQVERWAAIGASVFRRPFDACAQVTVVHDLELYPGEKPVRVKIRMDDVSLEQRVIYDHKLMGFGEAAPGNFEKRVWELGYDTQAALYTEVMNQMFPGEPFEFWFRVQEKHDFGYDDRFSVEYRIDETSRERALSHIRMQLQLIQSKDFRGYNSPATLSTERFKWGR
jgi:hypothetical protein